MEDKTMEFSEILADRLKMLRQERGLSCEKLSSILEEKYGLKIHKDTLKFYEAKGAHSKAGSNKAMKAEYLICLADFYQVSTDFLLGKSDVLTNNPNICDAVRATGIHEDTVILLNAWKRVCSLVERNREELTPIEAKVVDAVLNETNSRIAPDQSAYLASMRFEHVLNTLIASFISAPTELMYLDNAIVDCLQIHAERGKAAQSFSQKDFNLAKRTLAQMGYQVVGAENLADFYSKRFSDIFVERYQCRLKKEMKEYLTKCEDELYGHH